MLMRAAVLPLLLARGSFVVLMRAAVLPLLLARALSQQCTEALSLNTTALFTTAPYFASWNIDSSRDRLFFNTNFAAPQLVYLASQLSGAHIRFGGTGNDYLVYDVASTPTPCTAGVECLNKTWIQDLWALSQAAQSPLVFGINIHPPGASSPPKGPWDPANARALLTYLRDAGLPAPWGLELGNEQNTIMSAQQQAGAFVALSALLDSVYGAGAADRPALIGPDPHSFRDAGSSMAQQLAYIKAFITSLGSVPLRAVTHHEYSAFSSPLCPHHLLRAQATPRPSPPPPRAVEIDYKNILEPGFLDTTASIAASVMQAVRSVSASVEVWAGEVGPHNGGTNTGGQVPNCAANRVCGRYGSLLWYADSMALKAKAGYAAYCRQDLIGADYALVNVTSLSPAPDYYLLLLWKGLVGTRVLSVQQPAAPTTRAYAFCAAPGAAAALAGAANASVAALVLVNLQQGSSACYAAPAAAAQGATMAVYTLTPGAGGVESAQALLNGRLLELDAGGRLPQLPAASVPASQGINLPPMSVTIALLPLQDARACA